MGVLQYTTSLCGGYGQCNSWKAVPHCLGGVVGGATPPMHYLTTSGQWGLRLLQFTAPLPGGSRL